MLTKIYVIRHAEAEGNLYRRIHGWYDSLVTENGMRQIAALQARFAEIPVDVVYSSDLIRTSTTAQAICAPKELPLHRTAALREISLGAWEDATFGIIAQQEPEMLRLFSAMSAAFCVRGAETFATVAERVYGAFCHIAQTHSGKTAVLFTHGTAIRCLQGMLRGLPMDEWHEHLGHSDNSAVSYYEVEDGRVTICFENDNSHLSDEISTLARQRWWRRKPGGTTDANLWFRPLDICGDDATLYRTARAGAWQEIHGSEAPYDEAGFYTAAVRCASDDPDALLCAMMGEQPVGVLQLDVHRNSAVGVGHISFVYLLPPFRGNGLGVQLVGQAVSHYRRVGRSLLQLRCAPDNAVAQHFYHKYGFYKAGTETGSRVPLEILEKNIGYA
ncbi:MAG: bifunctional histidine phosphatase family protein/GNAT family N-acetyltransferase [Oscillospiraceae bacterium]|nr:bifunctional histidine phosphatase family protein/GNAT family N-acetyltransferase [Oscillospiraceae bacterium]